MMSGWGRVSLFDISTPSDPVFLRSDDAFGSAQDAEILGDNLYVAAGYAGLTLFQIVRRQSPKITIMEQPKSINALCGRGAGFTISASADPPSPLEFQWQKHGLDIPGANSSSYAMPSTSSADTMFDFAVVQGELYPFRLLYFDANGSANLEWWTQALNCADPADVNCHEVINGPTGVAAFRFPSCEDNGLCPPSPFGRSWMREGDEILLYLSFGGFGVVQIADNVTGPWTDLVGATCPLRFKITTPQKFFRVRH